MVTSAASAKASEGDGDNIVAGARAQGGLAIFWGSPITEPIIGSPRDQAPRVLWEGGGARSLFKTGESSYNVHPLSSLHVASC